MHLLLSPKSSSATHSNAMAPNQTKSPRRLFPTPNLQLFFLSQIHAFEKYISMPKEQQFQEAYFR